LNRMTGEQIRAANQWEFLICGTFSHRQWSR
jgi:hypothetical protein